MTRICLVYLLRTILVGTINCSLMQYFTFADFHSIDEAIIAGVEQQSAALKMRFEDFAISLNDIEMQSFAVLDGARFPGLREVLEHSQLEHMCLYTPDEDEDLEDLAPWLVRLETQNRFVLDLFSDPETSRRLVAKWGQFPGVLFMSKGNLATLRSHLRLFTKVPAKDGAWFFFRFWDEVAREALLDPSIRGYEDVSRFFLDKRTKSTIAVVSEDLTRLTALSDDGVAAHQNIGSIPPARVIEALRPIMRMYKAKLDLRLLSNDLAEAGIGRSDTLFEAALGLFKLGYCNLAQLEALLRIEFAGGPSVLERSPGFRNSRTKPKTFEHFVRLMEETTQLRGADGRT